MSRSPSIDMCNVRGIGVALNVRMSAVARKLSSFCLCSTPNRCSSSMITMPRSAKRTSSLSSRWVPITTSTFPLRSASIVAACSFRDLNRLIVSMRNG